MAVAEAQSHVHLGRGAQVGQHVDAGSGIKVHQPYLAGQRVARVIDQAHLHAPRMPQGHVYQSNLRAVQGVGIVVATELQATHDSRAYVGYGRELHTAPYAHGNVGERTQLQTLHGREHNVAKATDLHAAQTVRGIGQCGEHHTIGPAARRTYQQAILKTLECVDLAHQTHIHTGTQERVATVVNAQGHIGQAMPAGRLRLSACRKEQDEKQKGCWKQQPVCPA